ncbi:zf-TFIIB domain-containing protein [Candidatus Roizmanbacteria bacterium]|nr:zf-TFIIB domain-containing protein [Candidatus Roizmanbacteria bacterium]
MSCPNCHTTFQSLTVDNQPVFHCQNCGATFFEENGINRIKTENAFRLAEDKKTDEISAEDKRCPKDGMVLKILKDHPAVPAPVTLLQCQTCHGIFAYPDDLTNFKKAQDAKVNFLTLWRIPFASIASVLVFLFVAVISVSLFSKSFFLEKQNFTTTKADEVIKQILVTSSGRYLFFSFKTDAAFRAKAVFYNINNGTVTEKAVSLTPKKIHTLTVSDLSSSETYQYEIVIIDSTGKEVHSKIMPLTIK